MTTFVDVARDGFIALLTINRPDKLNALSQEVLSDLQSAVESIRAEESVRAAIITGTGKAFVAGADIAAMQNMTEEEGRAFGALGHAVFDAVQGLRFPVIAAVNGFALGGGCELALACDFVYASSKAKFGQPEVGLGIIPGFGGTQRLTRRVGSAMAKELVLTGKMIGADEALRIGLANAVVAPDELLPAVQKVASEIAEKGPIAVSTAKRLIDDGIHLPLSEANVLERDAFGACFGTEDQSEGMAAFLEKRGANFSGR